MGSLGLIHNIFDRLLERVGQQQPRSDSDLGNLKALNETMLCESHLKSSFGNVKAFNLNKKKGRRQPYCWGTTAGKFKFLRQTKGRTVFGKESLELESIREPPSGFLVPYDIVYDLLIFILCIRCIRYRIRYCIHRISHRILRTSWMLYRILYHITHLICDILYYIVHLRYPIGIDRISYRCYIV